jgi:predicted RecA/RadA family phage recombinase
MWDARFLIIVDFLNLTSRKRKYFMRNFVEKGDFLKVETEKSLKSGDLFVEDSLVGVCVTDSNTTGFSIATTGVFMLFKDLEIEIKLGQKVFSKQGEPVTTSPKDATYVGVATELAPIKRNTIKVRLA